MELVKTKSERYYNAIFDNQKIANKILIEILEEEKIKKNGNEKDEK